MNTIPLTNAGILDMSLDLLTAGRTELATQGFRKIVAKADALDELVSAIRHEASIRAIDAGGRPTAWRDYIASSVLREALTKAEAA